MKKESMVASPKLNDPILEVASIVRIEQINLAF